MFFQIEIYSISIEQRRSFEFNLGRMKEVSYILYSEIVNRGPLVSEPNTSLLDPHNQRAHVSKSSGNRDTN